MKKEEITPFNVVLDQPDRDNPLSVGNGNLAATVDVLGTQTFYETDAAIPLTVMSSLCFVTDPEFFSVKPTIYQAHDHKVGYCTDEQGQEEAFYHLRSYPYRFSFFMYAFYRNKEKVSPADIEQVHQELDLYHGIIESVFILNGEKVKTKVMVDEQDDVLRFEVETNCKGLDIRIVFPKTSSNKRGSLYPKTDLYHYENGKIIRQTEHERFTAYLTTDMPVQDQKEYLTLSVEGRGYFEMAILKPNRYCHDLSAYFKRIKAHLLLAKDPFDALLVKEFNRRLVLSLYLVKVNSAGLFPPQETGLTLNSWYSKFHLEMHPWHSLWMVEYGLEDVFLTQLNYYFSILERAKKRAEEQGYQGARLPKMTSFSGEDSPSSIGCLLLWQQPHLFLMLDAYYRKTKNQAVLQRFMPLLNELICFLQSFVYCQNDVYHLDYPIIPAQECFDPLKTRDPIFEVEYVRYAFKKMIFFCKELKKPYSKIWEDIVLKMVWPKMRNGCYLATADEQGKKTYTKFAKDHPLVLMPYSLFESDRIEPKVMSKTLDRVLKTYDLEEMWGWDFPMMAMCAYHLNRKKEALSLLLYPTGKNIYMKNGHNRQSDRDDLPLYLPGNGAFLLAASLFLNH